ncbi:MAG TPA: branched-chain amino acid ABC transporter permease [Streptosporangiaceae bacterium]|jgi:branched-chain amino acid transport system permease protein|nr:branched-chain amino acid ABC transporter permease [Streptosporangiaceae bacterium]
MSSLLGSDQPAAERHEAGTRAALARLGRRLAGAGPAGTRRGGGRIGVIVTGCVLAILAVLPLVTLQIPWILPGPVDVLNSAGTLEVLGLCFVFAGVAAGFDLLIGFTGLLSFGQVLYFATGVYVLDAALSVWHWALLPAAALTMAVGGVLAVLLGSISLKARGIAFAMVTLAFAQAGYYLIEDNPHGLTGGDSGLVMSTSRLPAFLVGVASTRSLYWLTLAFLVAAYGITWLATESVTGQVFLAIRESERRTEVLGLRPFPFKLASFVISSLIATAGGMVYLLLVGTAAPDAVASTTVTVSILVMVVLGGLGTRWGAVIGAIVYVYLQQYLLKIAAEPSFATLPAVLRVPLSQPDFLLGAIFIAFILFAPGGIAGLARRWWPARS